MIHRSLLTVLAVLVVTSSAFARVAQAPNSRVTLDVPQGFAPAERYAGFDHTAAGASIVILEAPNEAFDQMKAGLTADGLATRGVVNAKAGTLARQGDHVYMRAEQATPAGLFDKLFVLFRDGGQTVLVTANVPRAALETSNIKIVEIESALASARVVEKRLEQPLYALGYSGPLKAAGAMMGSGQLYTPDGQLGPSVTPGRRSMFILAPSIDRRHIPDIGPFAERALAGTPGVSSIEIVRTEAVEIAGLAGIRHEAKGANDIDGSPVQVLHVVLTSAGGGYVRLIGIAPETDAATMMPEFRKMAASLKPGS